MSTEATRTRPVRSLSGLPVLLTALASVGRGAGGGPLGEAPHPRRRSAGLRADAHGDFEVSGHCYTSGHVL